MYSFEYLVRWHNCYVNCTTILEDILETPFINYNKDL